MDEISPAELRERISAVLDHGIVSFGTHCKQRMAERHFIAVDVVNVLRDGQTRKGRWDGRDWIYDVFTERMKVEIKFVDESKIFVLTTVRIGRGHALS